MVVGKKLLKKLPIQYIFRKYLKLLSFFGKEILHLYTLIIIFGI